MPNEILLLISLLLTFGSVLLWQRLFGLHGLIAFNVLATVAANIEVLVVVDAFGLEQTLGNVIFASTFLVTDIISECYGKKESKRAVDISILTSVTFIALSGLWLLYTPSTNDISFPFIRGLFSRAPRVMAASLTVYALVQRFDVWLYHKIWELTEKKHGKPAFLWLRNNAATLISQLLNAILYSIAAFGFTYSFTTLLSIIASSYVIFIFTSLADTPIIYLARRMHRNSVEKEAKKEQKEG